VDTYIQLAASAFTIASTWFYGNKTKTGPIIGLVGQAPWLFIMVSGGLWGLLPVNALMFVIHGRNLWKMK
jgi:hypothetical protein